MDFTISRGDLRHFFPHNLIDLAIFPQSWDSSLNTGLGIFSANTLWITSYLNLTAFFGRLGLSWFQIEIIFWLIPILFLSFLGPFLLSSLFFEKKRYRLLSSLIYATNTYFITIFSGGQTGVCFGYALAPLVLYFFLKLLKTTTLRSSLLFSLALSLQILFDPRMTGVTLIGLLIFAISDFRNIVKNILYVCIIPSTVLILLHSFWLLPVLLYRSNALPQGFGNASSASFFSFAFLENSLSLLHPNWPENIFGKVYFMKPEFLLIPILTYSSLLFVDIKNKKKVLPLVAVGLIGAFLAKGTNDPLGYIYKTFIEIIPGFVVYRDPTKFYLLIALSYSILIPFILEKLDRMIIQKIKTASYAVVLLFLLFWVFLLRDGIILQKKFVAKPIPAEYEKLARILSSQKDFSRSLWIPQWQRFGYFSDTHPAIGRFELLKTASASSQLVELENLYMKNILRDLSIKYIIVSYDSEGEIFLTDRKYDDRKYSEVVKNLEHIKWLKKIEGFGKIAVFELKNSRDHFWSVKNILKSYKYINPTKYIINLQNVKNGDIVVFSESFDKGWELRYDKSIIKSIIYNNRFNSFILEKEGNYSIEAYYHPQKYVDIGLTISIFTLVILLLIIKL